MEAAQQLPAGAGAPAARRIEWIDVAKGLCMLLVVAGHTLPYGCLPRNFIFSFHMPAFFFLTGYTARRPDTWPAFARRVKRDFVGLIVPVLGVVQVFNVLLNFYLSEEKSLSVLLSIAKYNAVTLFWASGHPTDTIPSCGMPWFLFALFWAKFIWELVGLFFPAGGDLAVCFFISLAGGYIGRNHYLPQCLDVAMLCVGYLALGQLFRRHRDVLDRFRLPVFFAMLVPWAWCCQQGIYIELASRTYTNDNFILCAAESVCGIWLFCLLCQELTALAQLRGFLSFVGRHSLWLFFVHHMDVFISALWQTDSTVTTLLLRYAWDFGISLALFGLAAAGRALLRRRR